MAITENVLIVKLKTPINIIHFYDILPEHKKCTFLHLNQSLKSLSKCIFHLICGNINLYGIFLSSVDFWWSVKSYK